MNDKSLPNGTRLQSAQNVYTINNVIGSGGFGITYKATTPTVIGHIRSRAHIAIKEHFPAADCERSSNTQSVTFSSSARNRVMTSLKDFVEEAMCLQRIAGLHPNIVNVNEVFEANNTAYYVMEYIDGKTLKQYVKECGKLSVNETLTIMMPIIEAVATLHKNRFTHLDIKPSNIMLSDDDEGKVRPVLIDFGLAKHYNPDGSQTATAISSGFTDGYAPIEQYSGITRFSPTVDVYALGATMLFCLTGEKPPRAIDLQSPTALDLIIPKDVPSKLRRLLSVAMSFNASDRLPDARQLYLELEPIAESAGVRVVSAGMPVYDEAYSDNTRINDDNTRINADSTRYAASFNGPTKGGGTVPPPPPAPPRQSTPAWIWVIIGLLLAAIVLACILIFKENSGSKYDSPVLDSVEIDERVADTTTVVPAPTPEPEPIVINETNNYVPDGVATPDLAFHNLSGPVKYCKNQWGAELPYSEDGNWTGNYHDNLGQRHFVRDSQGHIVQESYNSSKEGSGTMYYTWSGNKVTSMTDNNRGQEVYYTYNSDGSMATQTIYSNGKRIEYRFSNEKRDRHGNWISRRFTRVTDDGYNTSTSSGTHKRSISYYD